MVVCGLSDTASSSTVDFSCVWTCANVCVSAWGVAGDHQLHANASYRFIWTNLWLAWVTSFLAQQHATRSRTHACSNASEIDCTCSAAHGVCALESDCPVKICVLPLAKPMQRLICFKCREPQPGLYAVDCAPLRMLRKHKALTFSNLHSVQYHAHFTLTGTHSRAFESNHIIYGAIEPCRAQMHTRAHLHTGAWYPCNSPRFPRLEQLRAWSTAVAAGSR